MPDIHYMPAKPGPPFCGTLAEGELHGTPDPAKVTCIACRALILAGGGFVNEVRTDLINVRLEGGPLNGKRYDLLRMLATPEAEITERYADVLPGGMRFEWASGEHSAAL